MKLCEFAAHIADRIEILSIPRRQVTFVLELLTIRAYSPFKACLLHDRATARVPGIESWHAPIRFAGAGAWAGRRARGVASGSTERRPQAKQHRARRMPTAIRQRLPPWPRVSGAGGGGCEQESVQFVLDIRLRRAISPVFLSLCKNSSNPWSSNAIAHTWPELGIRKLSTTHPLAREPSEYSWMEQNEGSSLRI